MQALMTGITLETTLVTTLETTLVTTLETTPVITLETTLEAAGGCWGWLLHRVLPRK